jgi:hypothetical protein
MLISFKKFLFLIAVSLFSIGLNAQSKKATVSATKFSGQMFIGFDNNSYYVNFGGPALKLVNKSFSITAGVLPSLRIKKDPARPDVLPNLGAGIMFTYKHLILGFPTYYVASENKWKFCAGIGFKLGK